MKVLYCNPSFWDYRLPFYKRLNELFEGKFYVVYSTKRYHGRKTLLERIKRVLGENALPYDNELMFDVKKRSFNGFTEGGKQIPLPFKLLHIIHKAKPDVLITEGFFQWTPFVILYSFLFQVPVFMGYERTLWTERNNGKIKTWHRKLTDKFITGYLVNGSETKKYLMSIGVNEEKIHIGGMNADSEGLRNDVSRFRNSLEFQNFKNGIINSGIKLTKYYSGTNKGIVYLFSGRVSVLKGADLLLAAWEKHIGKYPNDHIILIGYGDKSEELKAKYINEKSIHLEGRIDYTQVHKYYAIADVFILPTLTDNWSLVIPEAMSCGLPVATSIYNGCYPELVHEGENGYTFDTFKQDSILQALDYFHHVDLKSHGLKSIELEKKFNTEACAKREYDGVMKLSKRVKYIELE
ncbi:MAG: glycosyltransferase family 4 protein [Lachnospiraceae bacterium]|nr:glycosyltransferase family 4 protein [Lachnospiraceae bacterium]